MVYMQQLQLQLGERTAKYEQDLELHSQTTSTLQKKLEQANRTIKDQDKSLRKLKIMLENAQRDRDQFWSQTKSLETKLTKTKEVAKRLEKKLRDVIPTSELKTKNFDLPEICKRDEAVKKCKTLEQFNQQPNIWSPKNTPKESSRAILFARKFEENFLVALREQLEAIDRFTTEYSDEKLQVLRDEIKGGMQKESAILNALGEVRDRQRCNFMLYIVKRGGRREKEQQEREDCG